MRSRIIATVAGLLYFAGLMSLGATDGHAQGVRIDVGRFAPEARGIVIEFGRTPDGQGRFRLDVPQRGLHLDFRGNDLQSTGEFPFLPFPPAEGGSAVPDSPNDPLEPGIDLGEPAADLGEPAPDLGEPQTSIFTGDEPTAALGESSPTPAPGSNIDLGEPVSEPPAAIIPDPPEPGEPPPPAEPQQLSAPVASSGYMGVVAGPVSEAVAAHFADLLPEGAGLLVTSVVPESPASAAGLQPNDILVRYGDTSLSSFEQLTELVRSSDAGTRIVLGIVRSGEPADVEVTLGEAPLSIEPEPALPEPPFPPQATDFRRFLAPGQTITIPPDNVDMSAVGTQILEKARRLITEYRLVGVDYETLPGGRYRGVVTLADASGGIHQLPASGTETEVQLQLLRQLLELP